MVIELGQEDGPPCDLGAGRAIENGPSSPRSPRGRHAALRRLLLSAGTPAGVEGRGRADGQAQPGQGRLCGKSCDRASDRPILRGGWSVDQLRFRTGRDIQGENKVESEHDGGGDEPHSEDVTEPCPVGREIPTGTPS